MGFSRRAFRKLPVRIFTVSNGVREGNALSRVSLSTGGPPVTITNDALDFTVQPPPGPQSPWRHGPLAPIGTESDGTYSWQAGSTHPTGLLSCYGLFTLSDEETKTDRQKWVI